MRRGTLDREAGPFKFVCACVVVRSYVELSGATLRIGPRTFSLQFALPVSYF